MNREQSCEWESYDEVEESNTLGRGSDNQGTPTRGLDWTSQKTHR
jgi:hypothetical protein